MTGVCAGWGDTAPTGTHRAHPTAPGLPPSPACHHSLQSLGSPSHQQLSHPRPPMHTELAGSLLLPAGLQDALLNGISNDLKLWIFHSPPPEPHCLVDPYYASSADLIPPVILMLGDKPGAPAARLNIIALSNQWCTIWFISIGPPWNNLA